MDHPLPADKPMVLAIDDTALNLTMINQILTRHYLVKVALNGVRGLKIAQTSPQPSLILLDIMMPDMDGFEVCRQLKSNPVTAQIPVIFLSASSQEVDAKQSFELGAADFLSKPIEPDDLIDCVRTHIMVWSA